MQLILSAYEAEQRKKMYTAYGGGHGGSEMISPGTTDLTSVCYEYSYQDPNCNVKSRDAGIYSIGKNVSEHHYEQPMVIMPSRSPVDSIVKPLISDTSSSSTGGEASSDVVTTGTDQATHEAQCQRELGRGSSWFRQ